MKFKRMLYSLLILFLVLNRSLECIHDQIIRGAKLTPIDDRQQIGRKLQQNQIGGMRIYYQYNTTDIVKSDPLGANIMKIMSIIASFWSKTIQMSHKSTLSFNIDPSFDRDTFSCLSFQVSREILDNPIPNKDFGILVQAKNDGDNGVTAYSYPCAYSLMDTRPLWGLIHWNKNYIKLDALSFQQNLLIATHQVTHLFGFSSLLFPLFHQDPTVQIGSQTYVNGPIISQQLKRQYGCSNPIGMPLQSGGGTGTALSHWSKKVANNQLMAPGVSQSNPTISYITLALLQQSGWYTNVYKSFGKYINFGYQKGCNFLQVENCSSNEYCLVQNQLQCDYDQVSLGYCKKDSLSQCMYIKYYSNFICIDPNYQKNGLNAQIIQNTGEKGGQFSRCYQSNLHVIGSTPSKYSFRCYQTLCSRNGKFLTIRVGSNFALCIFPNQLVTVQGFQGTIRCPKSFSRVCTIKRCPQECNGNGICLNGRCLCNENYNGQSCSQISSIGFSNKQQPFLSSQNNNCMIGSYLTQFGDCQLCPPRCAICNNLECLKCFNSNKLPVNGECPQL